MYPRVFRAESSINDSYIDIHSTPHNKQKVGILHVQRQVNEYTKGVCTWTQRRKILAHATTWRNPEVIMLRVMNQSSSFLASMRPRVVQTSLPQQTATKKEKNREKGL
jgi:hypothetical protein